MANDGKNRLQDGAAPALGGRPRSARKDREILEATGQLLDEVGYHQMTVEAVARRAGVSKATIYVRYRDKADLAAAAVAARLEVDHAPDTGSTQTDLVVMMQQSRESLEAPAGIALGGALLSEEPRSPEALHTLRNRVVMPRRRLFREVLERGIARGEVRPDAKIDVVLDCLMGAYYGRRLLGISADANWAEDVVHALTASLLTEKADGAGRGSRDQAHAPAAHAP